MKSLPLLLGLALLPCASSKPQSSTFGPPLFVNGKRVSDDDIKLALIYGPCRLELEMAKIGVIIEAEIAHQTNDRAEAEVAQQEKLVPFKSPEVRALTKKSALERISTLLHEKYLITDEEFDAEYQYTIDDFRKSFPTLDLNAEICRAYRSVDWYREQLRQQMYFERVFLPPNPEDWPADSLEAIRADPTGGELLIPDAKQSYKARLEAAAKNGGNLPREDPLRMTYLRQIVRDTMLAAAVFKMHADGIDARLALWADADGDGKPELALTIDNLWDRVTATVTDTEIDAAKQWFVTSRATRDRLAKEGALLSEKEAREAIADLASSLAGNSWDLDQVATKTYFFPSVEQYCEYYVMRESFRKLIAPKLESGPDGALPQSLQDYYERANRSLGLGMVDSEVLLVSAFDIPRFRWKKDGWPRAQAKARKLRAQYDASPDASCWSKLLDENSEYWDPPPPEYNPSRQGGSSDIVRKKNGRFGPHYHSPLLTCLDETAYTEWVTGDCITDRIFFDQPEGTVAGPFKGPLGWYLTRVNKRTPPSRPLKLSEPQHMQALRDDYLRWAFIQYSKEAVAQADIRGWEPL
jgi:hypothetical protein